MKQIDTRYNEAVQQIKSAILQNQLEAAKAVIRPPMADELQGVDNDETALVTR